MCQLNHVPFLLFPLCGTSVFQAAELMMNIHKYCCFGGVFSRPMAFLQAMPTPQNPKERMRYTIYDVYHGLDPVVSRGSIKLSLYSYNLNGVQLTADRNVRCRWHDVGYSTSRVWHRAVVASTTLQSIYESSHIIAKPVRQIRGHRISYLRDHVCKVGRT